MSYASKSNSSGIRGKIITFLLRPFILLCLSAIGLFLALWIILPAPNSFLLPLGVGAPEVSPWLLVVNAVGLMLSLFQRKYRHKLTAAALVCSLVGLLLSLSPLLRFPAANKQIATEMQAVLGKDYLSEIPQSVQQEMRSQPLVLADVFRGIALEEVRTNRGIVFAEPGGEKLRLNVYRPLAKGKHPTLVVFYGGAWQAGSPDSNEEFNHYMAARGYSVVALDYRHAPQYRFPTQLEDVETALTYIKNHAQELEVDTKRIAFLGRSAGGHLAAIAAYDSPVVPVQAVVNYYGPVDLSTGYYNPPVPDPIDTRAVLETFLGGTPKELPELYEEASPINYVQPGLPPTLLVYAGRDHIVQSKFGRQLYEKLLAKENTAIFLEIPWAEHAFDAVFPGVSNQLALYYTERFLAHILRGVE